MSKFRKLNRSLALVIMLALVLTLLPMGAMAANPVTMNKTSRTLTDLSENAIGSVSVANVSPSNLTISGVSDAIWGVDDNDNVIVTILVSLSPNSVTSGTLAVTIAPTGGTAQSQNITVTGGEGIGTIIVNSIPYTIQVQSTEDAYTGTGCHVGAVAGEGVTLSTFTGSGTEASPYAATASVEVTGYPFKMSLRIIPDGSSYDTYNSYSYTVLDGSDEGTGLENFVGTYFLAEFPADDTTLEFSVTNGANDTTYYAITLDAQPSSGTGTASLYAYLPAPGQFTNEGVTIGGWGDAYTSGGTPKINTATGVSLGFFGGYVVYKFDSPVVNNILNPFGTDFIVYGNAFWNNTEPGCIQVAEGANGAPADVNGDGVIWYDIAASQYYTNNTEYASITYTNPNTSQDAGISAAGNNLGTRTAVSYSLTGAVSGTNAGTVAVNPFHNHSWWPLFANYFLDDTGRAGTAKISQFPFVSSSPATPTQSSVSSTLTFTGQRLITAATNDTASYLFGYADTHNTGTLGGTVSYNPYAVASAGFNSDSTYSTWLSSAGCNNSQASGGDPIDISWAVYPAKYDTGTNAGNTHPKAGQPVPTDKLESIQFVRIYTGAALNNGIFGELSTEVCGIAPVSGSTSETPYTPTITVAGVAKATTNGGILTLSRLNSSPVLITVAQDPNASGTSYFYINGVATQSASFTPSSSGTIVQIIVQNGEAAPYITWLSLKP